MRTTPAKRTRGFTLLEMLAVIALTALVLTAAADYYLDLSRASQEAVLQIQDTRRAARLLDRMARELEGSVLVVKPAEVDPIRHPWLFLAEADASDEGARRVKFVTRSHRPPAQVLREQDLAMVSYAAEDDGDGSLVLWRAASPHLPEELDLGFPRDERDGAQILSEDLAAFGLQFLTEDGEWVSRFDSSTLVQSGQLPRAAQIELAFLEQDELGEWVEGPRYQRRVVLPLRPLDIQAEIEAAEELAGGKGDEEEDEEGEEEGEGEDGGDEGGGDGESDVTVGDCLNLVPPALLTRIPDQQLAILESMRGQPLTQELRNLAAQVGVVCP